MAATRPPKGTSIEPIERTTNRPWSAWMAFMDSIGAERLDHAQIAQKVQAELEGSVDNPGWWAQGITVAYEQHSGRRLPGQQTDGTFQTSVSRTIDLPVQAAMDRWIAFTADDQEVTSLLASGPKTSGTDKRRTWRARAADGSSLVVTSELRPNGKTAVIVQQLKLPSQEQNVAAKELWAAVMQRFIDGL